VVVVQLHVALDAARLARLEIVLVANHLPVLR
jgi:hypothetical protein